MNTSGIIILGLLILLLAVLPVFLNKNTKLDKIKATKTGDGQYGTADFATTKEIKENLVEVEFDPKSWRKGINLPEKQGVIVGAKKIKDKIYVYVDTSDNHTMVVSSPGGGKTTTFLYPNLEYSGACHMSGFITDTKGNVFKEYAPILEKYYGAKTKVIDLRYPLKSTPYNFLSLVNKYMDKYKKDHGLADLALAQSYAKTIANSIIHIGGFKDAGQNQYFYTAAEGVISGITLLVSEFCEESERHIISVFKVIRECMEEDPNSSSKNLNIYLKTIYDMLPTDSTAKDLLAPAATSEFKTTASVLSTAMSQLLKFVDREMEQFLCFDSGIDIDEFVNGSYFIFFIVDEKAANKNFMVNLIIKQIYGELLKKAEEYDDICLPTRIVQWLDEFGTYTKIQGAEGMFSAGRSRNIISVPFLQTLAQLNKNYGKERAETIKNSCQNLLFSYQSPSSDDADFFSKKLGTKTVTAGSVSSGKNGNNSKTLSMVKMPIMSADEITKLKKGEWVFMKAGMNPSRMNFYRTKEYGITFLEDYEVEEKTIRHVNIANVKGIEKAIAKRYGSTPKQNRKAKKPYSHQKGLSKLEEQDLYFN